MLRDTRTPRARSSVATRSAAGAAPSRSNVARAIRSDAVSPLATWALAASYGQPIDRNPAAAPRASPRFQLANGSAASTTVTGSRPARPSHKLSSPTAMW